MSFSEQQLTLQQKRSGFCSYRPLLVTLSNMECVLEDGVHDPADAEGRLNDIGDNFFHCGWGKKIKCLQFRHLICIWILSTVATETK